MTSALHPRVEKAFLVFLCLNSFCFIFTSFLDAVFCFQDRVEPISKISSDQTALHCSQWFFVVFSFVAHCTQTQRKSSNDKKGYVETRLKTWWKPIERRLCLCFSRLRCIICETNIPSIRQQPKNYSERGRINFCDKNMKILISESDSEATVWMKICLWGIASVCWENIQLEHYLC